MLCGKGFTDNSVISNNVTLVLHQLSQELTCSICLSLFDEPILTSCRHVFCKSCINRAMRIKSDGVGAQGACPICKRLITRRTLHSSTLIQELMKKFNDLTESYKEEYKQNWEEALISTERTRESASKEESIQKTSKQGVKIKNQENKDQIQEIESENKNEKSDYEEDDQTQLEQLENDIIIEIDALPSSPPSTLFQSIHFSPIKTDNLLNDAIEGRGEGGKRQQLDHLKITSSLLSIQSQNLLERWSSSFGIKLLPTFDNQITHVITESSRPKRTIKTMMAILNGIWLVSIEWIKASLMKNTILPENEFEIQGDDATKEPGPKRSRFSKQLGECKLFDNFLFYLYGSFGKLEKKDILSLLSNGGASIIGNIDELKNLAKGKRIKNQKKRIIILCDPEVQSDYETDLGITGYFKPFIAVSWLLDCTSSYQIIDITHYKVVG